MCIRDRQLVQRLQCEHCARCKNCFPRLASSSRLPVEMHRGHPGVRSKQKAKGYSRCLPESLILVLDRLSLSRNLKEVSITGTIVITNRKSYMSFRLVPKSVTLNNLQRRSGRYFALFQRIRVASGRTAQQFTFAISSPDEFLSTAKGNGAGAPKFQSLVKFAVFSHHRLCIPISLKFSMEEYTGFIFALHIWLHLQVTDMWGVWEHPNKKNTIYAIACLVGFSTTCDDAYDFCSRFLFCIFYFVFQLFVTYTLKQHRPTYDVCVCVCVCTCAVLRDEHCWV